jgi:hypothetical protein
MQRINLELCLFNSFRDSETKIAAVTAAQELRSSLQSVRGPGLTDASFFAFQNAFPRQMQEFSAQRIEMHNLSILPENYRDSVTGMLRDLREQLALIQRLVQEEATAIAAAGATISCWRSTPLRPSCFKVQTPGLAEITKALCSQCCTRKCKIVYLGAANVSCATSFTEFLVITISNLSHRHFSEF